MGGTPGYENRNGVLPGKGGREKVANIHIDHNVAPIGVEPRRNSEQALQSSEETF